MTEKPAQEILEKKNILYSFILKNGRLRGCFINSTELTRTVMEKHSLGIPETLVLGHAFTGTALMAAQLKNRESIKLRIECSGPAGGLSVEAHSDGSMRGYLFQSPFMLTENFDIKDTSPLFQAGFLSVTRYGENNKSFTGQVMIEHGRIAEDLANYYLVSEQTRTAFSLSVFFTPDGIPSGAGGLFLQAMPEAEEPDLEEAELSLKKMPSIGKYLSESNDPVSFIMNAFSSSDIEILGSSHFHFRCRCSRERFYSFLSAMDRNEIESILKEGPLPLKVICHNCSSEYIFMKDELMNIRSG